ncbi:hypothetical protein TNCV_2944541 [Trichonephila clavipes]|nr:hypothetical protein TNCV_2944541 [Trichonephila clavipes]
MYTFSVHYTLRRSPITSAYPCIKLHIHCIKPFRKGLQASGVTYTPSNPRIAGGPNPEWHQVHIWAWWPKPDFTGGLNILRYATAVSCNTTAVGDGPPNFEPLSSDEDDTCHPLQIATPRQWEDLVTIAIRLRWPKAMIMLLSYDYA